MSLECLVCSDNFVKLKQLSCRHAFCSSCLLRIERFGKIRCPYCRQETQLSAFGVDDLRSLFGGQLECGQCGRGEVEVKDGVWCRKCTSILCGRCAAKAHGDHGLEAADRLGPVKFCVQQLNKLSAIHTKLTMIQKQLVRDYIQQLGEALERELDHDLTQRLLRLKAEKRHLQTTFDLEADTSAVTSLIAVEPASTSSSTSTSTSTPSSTPSSASTSASTPTSTSTSTSTPSSSTSASTSTCPQSAPDTGNNAMLSGDTFAGVLAEIYKMSPAALMARAELGALPKDGQIFNPLPLDKTVDLFFQPGRFSTFSISKGTLYKRKRLQVPVAYWGSDVLDDPSDLCVVTDRNSIYVTCVKRGLYVLSLDDGQLLRHYPVTVANDQLAGVAYDTENRFLLVSVLRNYHTWLVQVYEVSTMRLRDELVCPGEPHVLNSWYRWLTPMTRGRLIVSTGDTNGSVIWMVNLHSKRWTTLHVRADATYRKAAFHQPKSKNYKEGLLYVPDLRNKCVATFTLSRSTCELTNANEIRTEEFSREMPNCVTAHGGLLLVGNWNTGNIIAADLHKCVSQVLTSVGGKELFNMCYVQDQSKLIVLCKQKELIEVYSV